MPWTRLAETWRASFRASDAARGKVAARLEEPRSVPSLSSTRSLRQHRLQQAREALVEFLAAECAQIFASRGAGLDQAGAAQDPHMIAERALRHSAAGGGLTG